MIRYSYNSQFDPPAPFIFVRLRTPDTGDESGELPALLDSAADRTIVPIKVIEAFGLKPTGQATFAGFDGQQSTLSLFDLEVEPRLLQPVGAIVGASSGEPWVLLGRDVLNHYRLFLYGPDLAFEIG